MNVFTLGYVQYRSKAAISSGFYFSLNMSERKKKLQPGAFNRKCEVENNKKRHKLQDFMSDYIMMILKVPTLTQ